MHNLPFALPDIGQDEIDGVEECLRSGWLTSGAKVRQFEEAFAKRVGATHAISCSSATIAALLILDALGVDDKAEVIVPAYTFSGPAMMAHRLGARVVLADCKPGSYQIDPAHVEQLITPFTRVVMPTHFAGHACDMKRLKRICDENGVLLVDDAAHAFPTLDASTNNIVGSGRDAIATFFSFYATKTITTGEGGMITTNDDALAEGIRRLRLHGFNREIFDRYTNPGTGWRYDIACAGWKANMTDIAAAIGLGQLRRAMEMRTRRAEIAGFYERHLSGLDGLDLPEMDRGSAWHLFPIQVRNRDRFVADMARQGVQCSVHFIPLHHHSEWQRITGLTPGELPDADDMFAGEVSLPIYSTMTEMDCHRVNHAVRNALQMEMARAAGTE